MTNNVSAPKSSIVAMIGGIVSFVGLFLEMVVIEINYYISAKAGDSGIELLSDEGVTFGKYLPLIVAILGIILTVLCIVNIVMSSQGQSMPQANVITTAIAAVMLIVIVIFLALVSTKEIIDWEWAAGVYADDVRDLFQVNIGVGCWMMLIGSIVALIGGILGFYENNPSVQSNPGDNINQNNQENQGPQDGPSEQKGQDNPVNQDGQNNI